jgi:hypothetical protein
LKPTRSGSGAKIIKIRPSYLVPTSKLIIQMLVKQM